METNIELEKCSLCETRVTNPLMTSDGEPVCDDCAQMLEARAQRDQKGYMEDLEFQREAI